MKNPNYRFLVNSNDSNANFYQRFLWNALIYGIKFNRIDSLIKHDLTEFYSHHRENANEKYEKYEKSKTEVGDNKIYRLIFHRFYNVLSKPNIN